MIRRVRRQFILITMSMLTAVLLIPLVALNVITEAMSYRQTRNLLEQIAVNEVQIREKPQNPEQPPQVPGSSPAAVQTTDATQTKTETQTTITESSSSFSNTDTPASPSGTTPSKTNPAKTTKSKQIQTTTKVTPPVSRETIRTTTVPTPRTTSPPARTTAPHPTQPVQTFPRDDDWHERPEPEPRQDESLWDAPYEPQSNKGIDWMCSFASIRTLAQNNPNVQPPMMPENREEFPIRGNRGGQITIDHFFCIADASGTLTELEGTEDYTEAEVQALLHQVRENGKSDGFCGTLQYYTKEMRNGSLTVFSDRSSDKLMMRRLLWVSLIVFVVMEGIVFYLTMLLTKRAMRPMQETFERQRQFISDAGHELKTPLTVISANVDILYDEIGENKWLGYIRSQTERMRLLIGDMMNLTKLEFGDKTKHFTTFSLSNAISNAVLPFESQAFEQHKTLTLDIQEDLQYTGNTEQIQQLVSIFLDNAIKYSNENGEIRVTLQQVRDKKHLKIFNTGMGIQESEREKIFERFYRSDTSRTHTTAGGYGLGLSIAKSIADTHKIKIHVESEYGQWICFLLIL